MRLPRCIGLMDGPRARRTSLSGCLNRSASPHRRSLITNTSSCRSRFPRTGGWRLSKSGRARATLCTTPLHTFVKRTIRGCGTRRPANPSFEAASREPTSSPYTRPGSRPPSHPRAWRARSRPERTSCFRCTTPRTAGPHGTRPPSGSPLRSGRPSGASSPCRSMP